MWVTVDWRRTCGKASWWSTERARRWQWKRNEHWQQNITAGSRHSGWAAIDNIWQLSQQCVMYSWNLSLYSTRKLCCRKDDRAMRPIYGCPEFSGLPDYAHGYYSQHFSWYFVPINPMNVPTKFEVRSFTRSWDNRGYPKKIGQSLDMPTLPFLQNF